MRAAILTGALLAIGIGGMPALGAEPPSRPTPQQIGMLRWYETNVHGASHAVGAGPTALAFDGAHSWVGSASARSVSKLRASDGVVLGSWAVPGRPDALAIEGSHVWVASNELDASRLLKMRLGDGALVASVAFQSDLKYLVYDGANVWVTAATPAPRLLKVSGGNAARLGEFAMPSPVSGLAFDGEHVWAACAGADQLLKVQPGTGKVVAKYSLPGPQGLAFDGEYMWVAHSEGVTRLKALDGSESETFPVGPSSRLVFDGAHIWVAGSGTDGLPTLTKLRAVDGVAIATVPVTEPSAALAFDGINVWTANYDAGTVTKR